MIESDTDRLDLLKALGEIVSISDSPIYGVFENSYLELAFDSVGVASSEPTLTIRTSDANQVARGVIVKRGGQSFTVEEIQPDGDGMTLLRMAEL